MYWMREVYDLRHLCFEFVSAVALQAIADRWDFEFSASDFVALPLFGRQPNKGQDNAE